MTIELDFEGVTLLGRRGQWTAKKTEHGVRLDGEGSWLLRGSRSVLDAIQLALPNVSERLDVGVLMVEFGNTVGRFNVPHLGLVEVVTGKWGESDFDSMLQDITDVAAALPFAAAKAGSLPYDRSVAESSDLLYHAFVYLRHVLSESASRHNQLLPALNGVLREPHRHLIRRVDTVSLDQVRRLETSDVLRILQHPGRLVPVHVGLTSPLADALDGRLPEHVGESRPRVSFDTPENRFVKTFLGSVEAVLTAMARLASAKKDKVTFWRRIESEAADLLRQIRPITGHTLWQEVGSMTHLPASSTVLQQRRGYKRVFQHFVRLRLSSRLPVDEHELQDLMEIKDIALLYELWCFFRLVAIIGTYIGEPSQATRLRENDMGVDVPTEFEVSWDVGIRLLYNPRFAPEKETGRRAYSVGLRPDIALEVETNRRSLLHLFDAKFRVQNVSQVMDESEQSESAERRGIFKRGDLYKMHTYRDAIESAESVWVLYPGAVTRFCSVDGQTLSDFGSVNCPLRGVGAIPLQPTVRKGPITELIGFLTTT